MPGTRATRRDLLLAFRRSRDPRSAVAGPEISAKSPVVAVIGSGCLTHAGTVCEACRDACPVRAVRVVPRLRQVPTVIVLEPDCTGCGDCLSVCPVSAITLASAAHA